MEQPNTMDGTYELVFPEIVEWVDNHFRTQADKRHRAIAGLSMGGFHAHHISKQYPDMFDYVGLFSAIYTPAGMSEVYEDTAAKLKRQFAATPALYWITIGSGDFLYDQNVDFRATLDASGYPYTYLETDGGHIWRNWRIYLSEFLPLLFQK